MINPTRSATSITAGKLTSCTQKYVDMMHQAHMYEESDMSQSIRGDNIREKFSSSSSNNSLYESRRKKVFMNIDLISKDSYGRNDSMFKRSFYRHSRIRSNQNLNTLNGGSRSVDKGLDSSDFICE